MAAFVTFSKALQIQFGVGDRVKYLRKDSENAFRMP